MNHNKNIAVTVDFSSTSITFKVDAGSLAAALDPDMGDAAIARECADTVDEMLADRPYPDHRVIGLAALVEAVKAEIAKLKAEAEQDGAP